MMIRGCEGGGMSDGWQEGKSKGERPVTGGVVGVGEGETGAWAEVSGKTYGLLMTLAAVFFLGETALHIVYSDSYLDEVVYLAGGRGFVTGRFVPYVGGFQTNYPPVGFYAFGIVQKYLGPSFYVGRIQAAVFLGLTLVLEAYVANRIAGRVAALVAVWLTISTMFLMRLYVMAVPYSLVVFFIMSSVAVAGSRLRPIARGLVSGGLMALAVMTRQDMAPLLVVLFVYFCCVDRTRRTVLAAAAGALAVATAVILPFFPGAVRVFLSTPGWNLLGDALLVHQPAWNKAPRMNVWTDYVRIYRWLLFLCVLLMPVFAVGLRNRKDGVWKRLGGRVGLFSLVCGLFVVNFLDHIWPQQACPYCTLAYAAYYWPIGAMVLGVGVAGVVAEAGSRISRGFVFGVLSGVVLFSVAAGVKAIGIRSVAQSPLQMIKRTAEQIAAVTTEDDEILMIGNHHALFIAERQFFEPLVNWYYTYRTSEAEERLRRLALWNLRMLDEWLSRDATVVIFGRAGVPFPEHYAHGREIPTLIEKRVRELFVLRTVIEDAWEMPLVVYRRVSRGGGRGREG